MCDTFQLLSAYCLQRFGPCPTIALLIAKTSKVASNSHHTVQKCPFDYYNSSLYISHSSCTIETRLNQPATCISWDKHRDTLRMFSKSAPATLGQRHLTVYRTLKFPKLDATVDRQSKITYSDQPLKIFWFSFNWKCNGFRVSISKKKKQEKKKIYQILRRNLKQLKQIIKKASEGRRIEKFNCDWCFDWKLIIRWDGSDH